MRDTLLTVSFTKAEGSQNDFVIIDDRGSAIPPNSRRNLSRSLCHRRKGVGADGTIFIDASVRYEFTMSFFNPDGSVGSMCGNGGRCAALYAYTHGIAGSDMRFDALGREYRGIVDGNTVRLYFPEPLEIRLDEKITIGGQTVPCQYANTGAPHAVIFSEDLGVDSVNGHRNLDVDTLGRQVRHTDEFRPVGVNANFLFEDANGILHIRTFEKGVEAETEACGTGTIASAIIAYIKRGIAPPLCLETRNGDVLTVGFTVPGEFRNGVPAGAGISTAIFADGLYFEGRTNLVFSGEMEYAG